MGDLGPYNYNHVYAGDSRDLMAGIPDGSIHMICTDAPYGNNNTHVRSNNLTKETEIENDNPEDFLALMPKILEQSARILDPKESAFVCFAEGGGPKLMSNRVSDLISEFLTFDTTVVWAKGGLGMGGKYRRNHEFVFIAHRRGSSLRWFDKTKAIPTVVSVPRLMNQPPGSHPTEKPVRLMEFFISLHTQPGDTVLDPFCGSGSTGVACVKNGRRFLGLEIDARWQSYSNDRISKTEEQISLF